MRIDPTLADQIHSGRSLGVEVTQQGTALGFERPAGRPYPPPGYLPWNLFDVGNGDTYGFYWPIGREELPPIVCTTMHDGGTLFPVASGFTRAVQLLSMSHSVRDEEAEEAASDFLVNCKDLPEAVKDANVGFWGCRSDELILVDPDSPSVLLAAAKRQRANGNLELAEKNARHAVQVLPEYAGAWALLADIARQARNIEAHAEAAVYALTCPEAFDIQPRLKLLQMLQRLPDSVFKGSDPFWARRREFRRRE